MADGLGAAMAAAHNREKADEALKRVAALESRVEALENALHRLAAIAEGWRNYRVALVPSDIKRGPGDIQPISVILHDRSTLLLHTGDSGHHLRALDGRREHGGHLQR